MVEPRVDLRETDRFILEPNGPIRFVKVEGVAEGETEAWISPADAFMRGQHQCVCEQWETVEVCIRWKGEQCVQTKTVKTCVSWHCGHDH